MSYRSLLNSKFDILERSSTDSDNGRPSRTWSVKETSVVGRLETISAEERTEMEQYFHAVTHKIWILPSTEVDPEDIFRPAGEESGPAYAVQGIVDRQSRIKFAVVEETQPDDASDYFEA